MRGAWLLVFVLMAGLSAGCSSVRAAEMPAGARAVADAATLAVPADAQPDALPIPRTPPTRVPDMATLRQQLTAYLEQQDGRYGVFVIDLTTRKVMSINGNETFYSASTIKLPLAIYILDMVAQGKADLSEMIAYAPEDYYEGTGVLQGAVNVGDTYPVRDLLRLSITESDNIATNMLLRRFGYDNLFAYMEQLGGKVTGFEGESFVTTPRDMALYMARLTSGTAVQNEELRTFLLDALEHTSFEDRIAAGVPAGVGVAHKIGTLPNVVNDIALVKSEERPFIVAIFSQDVDDATAPEVLSEITRTVYDFLHRG
jgi:beta-lactamase class A